MALGSVQKQCFSIAVKCCGAKGQRPGECADVKARTGSPKNTRSSRGLGRSKTVKRPAKNSRFKDLGNWKAKQNKNQPTTTTEEKDNENKATVPIASCYTQDSVSVKWLIGVPSTLTTTGKATHEEEGMVWVSKSLCHYCGLNRRVKDGPGGRIQAH